MSDSGDKKSNILLLCMGFDMPEQILNNVRVTDLLEIFAPFANLRKIMIFLKTGMIKAFIEFSDIESAVNAREMLHEVIVDNYGKAKLYYSNREKITCSSNYLDYWEADGSESVKSGRVKKKDSPQSRITPKSSIISYDTKGSDPMIRKDSPNDPRGPYDLRIGSPTQDPAYDPSQWVIGENRVLLRRLDYQAPITTSSMFQNCQNGYNDSRNGNNTESRKWSTNTNTASRVISISNLDQIFDTSKEIFNFFSCFGCLIKVLLIKSQNRALLEFSTYESAQLCLDFVSKAKVDRLAMRVSYSSLPMIDPKKEVKPGFESHYDFGAFSEHHQRRSVMMGKPILPSSEVFVNFWLGPDLCGEDVMQIFESVAESMDIRVIDQRCEFMDKTRVVALYSLSNVFEAILAVAKLHATDLNGCFLDICFA